MRYIGLGLAFLAAYLLTSFYKAAISARVDTLGELVRLVGHIRSRVSGYLEPPATWAKGYSSDNEHVESFLCEVRSGVGTAEAYSAHRASFPLSAEAKERLGEFFERLGSDTLSAERRDVGAFADSLYALYEKERSEADERSRIGAVMALMISVGVALLVI